MDQITISESTATLPQNSLAIIDADESQDANQDKFDDAALLQQRADLFLQELIQQKELASNFSKKSSADAKSSTFSASSLSDNIICKVAEFLDHQFVLIKLSVTARSFYIAIQLRYKSLCIKNGFITLPREIDPSIIPSGGMPESNKENFQVENNDSRNFPIVVEKNMEERMMEAKNYMSIYGKMMSKQQLVIHMDKLKLDPLNPESIIIKDKPRRLSEHQIIGDNVHDDDIVAPSSNLCQTFRKNSLVKEIYTTSQYFRVIKLSDGRHYINKIDKALYDIWNMSNEQIEALARDTKQMIRIPHCNIDQIYISQNQFIFTTRAPGRLSQLYHGVVQEVPDEDQPQFDVLIPDPRMNYNNELENRHLKIQNIHGPIEITAKDEKDKEGNALPYQIDIKLISMSNENCLAVIQKIFAEDVQQIILRQQVDGENRQMEFLYSWTLESLTTQMDSEGQELLTKQIYKEIPVIPWETEQVNKKQGAVQSFPTFKEIKSMLVRTKFALRTICNNVFFIERAQQGKDNFVCRHVKKLNNIVKLEVNTHFMALQRVQKLPISEWNPEQVATFIEETGFPEISKMAISHKITGKMIMNFDQGYWKNQFGIYDKNELEKIRYEISLNQKGKLISQDVLGWGNNFFGQLGHSSISQSTNIPHPKHIPLPEEIQSMEDEILDIKCGRRHSVILTQSGNVWVTGNLKEEKNMRLQQLKAQDDKFEEEKNQNGDHIRFASLMAENIGIPKFQKAQDENHNVKDKHYQKHLKKQKKRENQQKQHQQKKMHSRNNAKEDDFSKKIFTRIEFDSLSGQPIERRLKGNQQHFINKMINDRENNKLLNQIENNVKHRWINLVEKRGDKTVIPHKYQIESLMVVDHKFYLILNVSRKFVPIGSIRNQYFVPADDYDADSQSSGHSLKKQSKSGGKTSKQGINRWGNKFRDVDKAMAYLCYDRKIFSGETGSQKVYTVVYEDKFIGTVETEVWRFHEEMDIPSDKVKLLKKNGQIIWDRKNKFSLI